MNHEAREILSRATLIDVALPHKRHPEVGVHLSVDRSLVAVVDSIAEAERELDAIGFERTFPHALVWRRKG